MMVLLWRMLLALTILHERAWLLLIGLLGQTSLSLTGSPEQTLPVEMGSLARIFTAQIGLF